MSLGIDSSNLLLRWPVGSPYQLRIQFADGLGGFLDLTGRNLRFAIFRAGGKVIFDEQIAVDGPIATAVFDGGVSRLRGLSGARWQVAQLFEGGATPLFRGQVVTVDAAADQGADVGPPPSDLLTWAPATQTLIVSSIGAPGPSFSEELGTTPEALIDELVTVPVAEKLASVDDHVALKDVEVAKVIATVPPAIAQARSDVAGLITATGEAFSQSQADLDAHVVVKDAEIAAAVARAATSVTAATTALDAHVAVKDAQIDAAVSGAGASVSDFLAGAQAQFDGKLPKAALPTTGVAIAGLPFDRTLADWFGKDRLNVITLGMVGDGVTNDGPALAAALLKQRLSGIPLVFPERTYAIDRDYVIDWDNFSAFFEGAGATFVQKTHGCGIFQIRGNSARLTGNITGQYNGVRTQIVGTYRGYTSFQRMCVLWIEGSSLQVDGIVRGKNMFNTVCHRGPVARLDGTPVQDTDGGALHNGNLFATDNYIRRITGIDQDFTYTGTMADGLTIGSIFTRNVTHVQGIPSHATYSTPGSIAGAKCKNMKIGPAHCIGSSYGPAFKWRYVEDSTFGEISVEDCTGVLLLTAGKRVTVNLGACSDLKNYGTATQDPEDDGSASGIDLTGCSNVSVYGGVLTNTVDQPAVGVRVRNASSKVRFFDTAYEHNETAGVAGTPFRVEDTSEVTFNNPSRSRLGVGDKEMFVATGTAQIRLTNPQSRGSAKLISAAAGTAVIGSFNSDLVDGFTTSASFSGTVAAISLSDQKAAAGTCSPQFVDLNGVIVTTPTTRVGEYVVRNGYTTLNIRLALAGAPGFASGSAALEIDLNDFPYTIASAGSPPQYQASFVDAVGMTVPAGSSLTGIARAGTKRIRLQTRIGVTRSDLNCSALASGQRLDMEIRFKNA